MKAVIKYQDEIFKQVKGRDLEFLRIAALTVCLEEKMKTIITKKQCDLSTMLRNDMNKERIENFICTLQMSISDVLKSIKMKGYGRK